MGVCYCLNGAGGPGNNLDNMDIMSLKKIILIQRFVRGDKSPTL